MKYRVYQVTKTGLVMVGEEPREETAREKMAKLRMDMGANKYVVVPVPHADTDWTV